MTLDAIKGSLVLAMIVYHACYVAVMFSLLDIELYSGFWWVFPRMTAAGFVSVSGWNLAAKRARCAGFSTFARRAGLLALVAFAISVATWPVLGKGFVFFGVIHLLALSSLLAYPLLGRPIPAFVTGIVTLAAGIALGKLRFDFVWLSWLGLRPADLHPADYLPLAPWFAFIAFGSATRDALRGKPSRTSTNRNARQGNEQPAPSNKAPTAVLQLLATAGRHSLVVYLAHLPLLYGLGCMLSLIKSSS
jgi:uncharacterized membrane protein